MLCDDILRHVCTYLNVKDCVNIEHAIYKTTPDNYHLFEYEDYKHRKRFEPYKKTIDSVTFHVLWEKCYSIKVITNKNVIIEKYFIDNAYDSKEAFKKSFHLFTRAPGFWYQK